MMPSVEEILAEARKGRERKTAGVGAVKGTGSGQQHVDLYKKVQLRRNMLRYAVAGAAYVPFCGEGDLAVELYADRTVYGADLDAGRVATAQSRLPDSFFKVGDCDVWPFAEPVDPPLVPGRLPRPRTQPRQAVPLQPFAVGDFDAYSYPYDSFRAWWENAPRLPRLVVFFTDGQLQSVKRNYLYRAPTGERVKLEDKPSMRKVFNGYWSRIMKPWFTSFCADEGFRVLRTSFYTRSGHMLYWAAAIEAT